MGFAIPMIATGLGASAATAATLGTIGTVVSTGLSVIGALQQGRAASASAKYNAGVAANNAEIAKRNASATMAAGDTEANMVQRKTRSTVGSLKTDQAASGIDVNSKSAVDVRSSASELGMLDALSVRSNAARRAYGYQTDAASYSAQSQLDRFEASNASTAGYLNAGATLLGGIGDPNKNFLNYRSSGGL